MIIILSNYQQCPLPLRPCDAIFNAKIKLLKPLRFENSIIQKLLLNHIFFQTKYKQFGARSCIATARSVKSGISGIISKLCMDGCHLLCYCATACYKPWPNFIELLNGRHIFVLTVAEKGASHELAREFGDQLAGSPWICIVTPFTFVLGRLACFFVCLGLAAL